MYTAKPSRAVISSTVWLPLQSCKRDCNLVYIRCIKVFIITLS